MKYDVNYIAEQCGVKRGSIVSYVKYCSEAGIEIPQPIPYQSSKYVYSKQDADKIIEMFRNKKRGEMAQYNYKHCCLNPTHKQLSPLIAVNVYLVLNHFHHVLHLKLKFYLP